MPDVGYANPCVALVRASQGAQGWSGPHSGRLGPFFWTGIRESALKGLGLRVTDGVAWIDVIGYYDTLQRSGVQSYGQRSAQMPKQPLSTPMWANVGVHGPEDTTKVNNGRIDLFIRKLTRDCTIKLIRSKGVTFDSLAFIDPATAPTRVAPTLHMKKFVKTCPNLAGFLPCGRAYCICSTGMS